jgi:hypothetical protein
MSNQRILLWQNNQTAGQDFLLSEVLATGMSSAKIITMISALYSHPMGLCTSICLGSLLFFMSLIAVHDVNLHQQQLIHRHHQAILPCISFLDV